MKFCKDCKHSVKGAMYWWCSRNARETISPVDGSPVQVGTMDCAAERMGTYDSACGPEAQYFEPREAAHE